MIPILTINPQLQESEAAIKYFLVQTVGRALLLLGASISYYSPTPRSSHSIPLWILLSRIILKLGAAPTHWWLPRVIASISWVQCIIISTWQKVAPLALLTITYYSTLSSVIMIFAISRAFVGGVGGINQSHLRPLLAYSSIGHLRWMIVAATINPHLIWIYFFVYSTINLSLIRTMRIINQLKSGAANALNKLNPNTFWMLMIMISSLGGLPPLLGFLPKWCVISILRSVNLIFVASLLILGSLINLFYYLSMIFNYILTPNLISPPSGQTLSITTITLTCLSSMPFVALV